VAGSCEHGYELSGLSCLAKRLLASEDSPSSVESVYMYFSSIPALWNYDVHPQRSSSQYGL
jgi:hypothetical protein